MEGLRPQISKEILQIISIANFTLDQDLFRHKILEALFKSLYIECSVFLLPDENSKFTDFIVKNIDEKYVSLYKDYFCRHDPFSNVQKCVPGDFL